MGRSRKPSPKRELVLRWTLFVGIIGILAFASLKIGIELGRMYVLREIEDEQKQRLLSGLRSVSVGSELQDFSITECGTGRSRYLSSVLPEGGLILALSSEIPDAPLVCEELRMALRRNAPHAQAILLLLNGELSGDLCARVRQMGVQCLVAIDDSDWLRAGCGVPTGVFGLVIDRDFTLMEFSKTGPTAVDFTNLLD